MMGLNRRRALHILAGSAASAAPRFARAADYPDRAVKIVVGFPAGSTSDGLARLIAQRLSERLGQPFVVEDRTGASGNIATEAVVNAPPDGYTLLLSGSNHAINDTLYANLPFSFSRDIAPVAGVMQTPGVMEVNPSVPAKTVPEFIAYAKANSGKINMGSGGTGSLMHIVWRPVHADDRRQTHQCDVSRRAAGAARSPGGTGASRFRQRADVAWVYQGRAASRAGRDGVRARRCATGHSAIEQILAGL
jgi:hypothetical protein